MTNNRICTVTFIHRPKRKLIFLPAQSGTDYWSYCQERGCDWEGLLSSIPSKLDMPALLFLNPAIVPQGFSNCAAGIEVANGYTGKIPTGYLLAELEAGEMLYFQSEPYTDEQAYTQAIEEVFTAYENYDPETFGYQYDKEIAPTFNFGAFKELGARIGFPVKKRK